MSDIKCTVNECTFYSSNKCTAPKIEVNHTDRTSGADTSSDTMCDTFRKK